MDYYIHFVKRNGLVDKFNHLQENILFLASTRLLNENISLPVYLRLAQAVKGQKVGQNETIKLDKQSGLYFIKSGKAELRNDKGDILETLHRGGFGGSEDNILKQENQLEMVFSEDSELLHAPLDALMNIPIVYWKLLHIAIRRCNM